MKTVTVARLLVTRAATADAGVGAHFDSTAYVGCRGHEMILEFIKYVITM